MGGNGKEYREYLMPHELSQLDWLTSRIKELQKKRAKLARVAQDRKKHIQGRSTSAKLTKVRKSKCLSSHSLESK